MKIKPFVRKKARVEMMPLIDTMFLLLVFFIFAMLSMVVHKGIDVDLPQGETPVLDRKDYHVVIVTKDGQLYVNDDKLTEETLGEHLKDLFDDPEEASLYLRIDKAVPHGRVMRVMDIIRLLGIHKMFFEMEQKE